MEKGKPECLFASSTQEGELYHAKDERSGVYE